MGTLSYDEKNQPVMMVGAYKLTGKVVPLKKPVVMLDKKSSQVQGIFKTKIIFDARPTLVFSQPINKKL